VLVVRRATTRTGVRLGLIADRPPSIGVPSAQPGVRASAQRAQVQAALQEAGRLVMQPGPTYFAAVTLACGAVAFVVGLWLF
jgi:hypothetical protein